MRKYQIDAFKKELYMLISDYEDKKELASVTQDKLEYGYNAGVIKGLEIAAAKIENYHKR